MAYFRMLKWDDGYIRQGDFGREYSALYLIFFRRKHNVFTIYLLYIIYVFSKTTPKSVDYSASMNPQCSQTFKISPCNMICKNISSIDLHKIGPITSSSSRHFELQLPDTMCTMQAQNSDCFRGYYNDGVAVQSLTNTVC